MGGWMGGWMDGWMGGKAGLRIAYSNQKLCLMFKKHTNEMSTTSSLKIN
jgi:hypothetical protein